MPIVDRGKAHLPAISQRPVSSTRSWERFFAAPYGLCFSCLARFRFPVKCRLVPLRWCACIHTGEFDEVPGPRLWRCSAGRHFHSTFKLQFNPNIVNGTGPRVWKKSTCFFASLARRNLLSDQDLAHDVVLDFLSSVRVILQYPVTYMAVWYYSRSGARDGYLVDSGNDVTHTSPMNIVHTQPRIILLLDLAWARLLSVFGFLSWCAANWFSCKGTQGFLLWNLLFLLFLSRDLAWYL